MEDSVTVLGMRRGSVWGTDGRFYPSVKEGAVTPPAPPSGSSSTRTPFYAIYSALREMVHVAGDQLLYDVPRNPTRKLAPDVWVCYGVPEEPERNAFRIS